MRIILRLNNLSKSGETSEYQFDHTQSPITLGRGNSNKVILIDPQQIISRNHAKITISPNRVQLVDLDSQNYTYLNDKYIEPWVEIDIIDGDKIKIGCYEINVSLKSTEESIDSEISFFKHEVKTILNNLITFEKKFSLVEQKNKEQLLQDIIKNEIDTLDSEIWSTTFINAFLNVSPQFKSEGDSDIHPAMNISINRDNISEEYINKSVDLLLNAVIKLLKSYIVFQNKFFKITFHQDVFEFLKTYISGKTKRSKEECEQNLLQLQHIIQKVFHHQLGLLEGYKVAINKGVSEFLKTIDPQEIENKHNTEKIQIGPLQIPYSIIPFLMRNKVYREIHKIYDEYRNDLESVEKKYFRPAFKEGYDRPFDEAKYQSTK